MSVLMPAALLSALPVLFVLFRGFRGLGGSLTAEPPALTPVIGLSSQTAVRGME